MSTAVAKKAFTKPVIRRKALSAVNGAGPSTRVNFGEFGEFVFDEPAAHGGTGLGPSPLQGVLGALCVRESVTFSRTAAEAGFGYSEITLDAAFTIDIRGRRGARGVVPHFQTVKVEARVQTAEPALKLVAVAEETKARCPVFNLIKDAGVNIQMVWIAAIPK